MDESYFGFLRNIDFFKELTDEDIRNIERYCSKVFFNKGDTLFNEGDPADKFYIVMEGEVEVWKSHGSDEADRLAVHGSGHLFGEMAIIDDMPRSATVIAKDDVMLLQISEDDFQKMIKEKTAVAFSIIRSLSSMVRKSNETFLEDLKTRNLELEKTNRELKETQAELIKQERLSNLGKFSSMILHDLRNPISVVKAYTDMLMNSSEVPDKLLKYISNIKFEAERLNNLANEILDYSRGDIRLNLKIVDIGDFLEIVKETALRRFGNSNIAITIENFCTEPVMMDYERMLRVMMNIAENARKAIGRKGCFSIKTKKIDHSLVISIKDDGVGMDEVTLNHLFEPFYSSSKSGGTGLGMVVVKNVVEAHDGQLLVKSSPGKGTLITISIPAR